MDISEKVDLLAAALSALQGELEDAVKNATNPHYRSDYANLSEVLTKARPLLSKNKLSVIQSPTQSDGNMTLYTLLLHSSGQFVKSELTMPLTKKDPQSIGSAITYARRYALSALLGISQVDDDAECTKAPERTTAAPVKEKKKDIPNSAPAPVESTEQFKLLTQIWSKFKRMGFGGEEIKKILSYIFPDGPIKSSEMTIEQLQTIIKFIENKSQSDLMNIIGEQHE